MAHRFYQQKLAIILLISTMPALALAADKSPSFEAYGFGQADYVQDFKRVDPAWADTLRASKIPTTAGTYGSDGQAILSARQSRFGVKGLLPVEQKDLSTKFEFDLFGVGADQGKTTIRLRHAYGQWGEWLGGQTHSVFMDVDVFPNVIDYWGPSGMVFLRTPQLRWIPLSGENSVAVAIENPSTGVDPGNVEFIDPNLGTNIEADNKLPDLTAHVRAERAWGHVQLAGILRRLGYDTLGTPNNDPSGHTVGWGFDLTSNIKFLEKDKLLLSAVYGRGIANYMNDGGTDLAPEVNNGVLSASAVPLWGVLAYIDHYWNAKFSTSFGYSRTQVSNRNFQSGSAFRWGQYASANLLYTPIKQVLMGVEALWGNRMDYGGASGNDARLQISFKYSFSSNDFKPSI
jgi:hypothetical protein